MAYASGKYAQFISDRSGVAFPYRDMRIEWNGSRVAASEFEEKQPQLNIAKNIVDPEALKNASTDRTEPAVEVLLNRNAFKSGSSGSAVITVTEAGHGRSTGDTVRFRNVIGFDGFSTSTIEQSAGYTITKVNDDRYTFSAASGTATTGSVSGGGEVASAGPVTVSA
jgi:2-polyprenyl-6-methoxyphenol hydroxylase-like FAD-dependent oxidoreductase